jgi:hypothetical protein
MLMDRQNILRKSVLVLRWTARLWSVASGAIILLFFLGEGVFADSFYLADITPGEWLMLAFFPSGIVAGMGVAWQREGAGGAITVGSLLAFYGVNAALGYSMPRGPYFALLAAPGLLFLACWLLARRLNAEPRPPIRAR